MFSQVYSSGLSEWNFSLLFLINQMIFKQLIHFPAYRKPVHRVSPWLRTWLFQHSAWWWRLAPWQQGTRCSCFLHADAWTCPARSDWRPEGNWRDVWRHQTHTRSTGHWKQKLNTLRWITFYFISSRTQTFLGYSLLAFHFAAAIFIYNYKAQYGRTNYSI